MNISKVQKIALAASAPTPRRKVLKVVEDEDQDLAQTQEFPVDGPPFQKMDEDEDDEYEDDGVTDTLEEEFNAHAEELFLDKLDRWFAEFGPKLYDLGLSKHLSKLEKKKLKEEPSETSRRSTKKSRK